MEWEECTQYTETDKYKREEYLLNVNRDIVHIGYLHDIHRGGSTEIVDSQNTDNQQSGTSHQHQSQFHSCILLRTASPYSDKEVHRYQGYLIEHEHREHVGRDKETIYS